MCDDTSGFYNIGGEVLGKGFNWTVSLSFKIVSMMSLDECRDKL